MLIKLLVRKANYFGVFLKQPNFLWGAGKTMLTFTVSVNILSAKFLFCVVPAGGEGGGNRKYVDVSGKC